MQIYKRNFDQKRRESLVIQGQNQVLKKSYLRQSTVNSENSTGLPEPFKGDILVNETLSQQEASKFSNVLKLHSTQSITVNQSLNSNTPLILSSYRDFTPRLRQERD